RRGAVPPQHDGRGDVLAQGRVRNGEGHGLRHCRMLQESFVDFPWGDFLSAAIDDFLAPTREKQVSVVIEKTVVSGLEPSARKGGLACPRVAVIAVHDACATDDDLPGMAGGQ